MRVFSFLDLKNVMNWPNFSRGEFACTCAHCDGENKIADETIDAAQAIRTRVGFPMTITSGYRCNRHPIEKAKMKPGTHARGLAFDVACSHDEARAILDCALDLRLGGIGVNQRGSGRFIHVDVDPSRINLLWTY